MAIEIVDFSAYLQNCSLHLMEMLSSLLKECQEVPPLWALMARKDHDGNPLESPKMFIISIQSESGLPEDTCNAVRELAETLDAIGIFFGAEGVSQEFVEGEGPTDNGHVLVLQLETYDDLQMWVAPVEHDEDGAPYAGEWGHSMQCQSVSEKPLLPRKSALN